MLSPNINWYHNQNLLPKHLYLSIYWNFSNWFVDLIIRKKGVSWVPYKISSIRTIIFNVIVIYEVEKFDGKNNFNIWQYKIIGVYKMIIKKILVNL